MHKGTFETKALAATIALAALLRLPALAGAPQTTTLAQASPTSTPTAVPLGSVNIPNDYKWHFSVTPYVFVPDINGTFQFPVPALGKHHAPVTISPHEPAGSYLQHINGLTMMTGEARNNRFVTSFDYIWLNISTQKAGVTNVALPSGAVLPLEGDAGFRVTANIWTVAAGGTIVHSDSATVDALIGVRSLNLNTALNWNFSEPPKIVPQSGTIAKSGTITDVVAELRGKVRLGNRVFAPYYFDGGYGNKSTTLQAAAGLAYAERWGSVGLIYRALIYNANPVSLNQRLTFNGPAIGATFKF